MRESASSVTWPGFNLDSRFRLAGLIGAREFGADFNQSRGICLLSLGRLPIPELLFMAQREIGNWKDCHYLKIEFDPCPQIMVCLTEK